MDMKLGVSHRLKVFENRVLRRIFGSKREEVAGGWRRSHSEGLHNFYTVPNITIVIKSRRLRWVGHVTYMGKMRFIKNLVIKPEGRKPFGRPKRRWEDNISTNLK
jgi:hypothetical protein